MKLALVLSLIIVGSFSFAASTKKIDLPKGWKPTKPIKDSGCDRSKTDLLTAEGDFNGDGKPDRAKLLAKATGKGIGLWVWLSKEDQPILIKETESEDGKHDIGISLLKPGSYKTACGKGYWQCKGDEVSKVNLKNDGIDLMFCESANALFYWDEISKKFKEIPTSD